MVEQEYKLDALFRSLSDPTRRDILKRVSKRSMNVGSIARFYKFSLAGVAKHLDILEHAGLVSKTRLGKEQIVTIEPLAFAVVSDYLEGYKQLWEQRLDSLDVYLKSINKKG
jgi:DNA-binding transcriptional ArsR family regulator